MFKHIRSLVVTICLPALVVALSTFSFAQNATPKYDTKAEATYTKAIVQDVKSITENGKDRVHLTVKAGEETLDVYLCPKDFLTSMDTSFAKGDEVDVTGSKVKVEDAIVILAREVVKGNNTLVLRDKAGAPVWSWMEKTAEGR